MIIYLFTSSHVTGFLCSFSGNKKKDNTKIFPSLNSMIQSFSLSLERTNLSVTGCIKVMIMYKRPTYFPWLQESCTNSSHSSMRGKMLFLVLFLIGSSIGQEDQTKSSMLQIFLAKISGKPSQGLKGKSQILFCNHTGKYH